MLTRLEQSLRLLQSHFWAGVRMFTIVFTTFAMLAAIVYLIGVGLRKQTRSDTWNRTAKSFRLIYAGFMICLLISIYPFSSGRRAQAERLAQDFMTAISIEDYEAARDMTDGRWNDNRYWADRNDLQNPNNRPVSWNLSELRLDIVADIVQGTAVFPDGAELPLTIEVEWRWTKGRWFINSVEFGKFGDETRLYFSAQYGFFTPKALISILLGPTLFAIIFGGVGLIWVER